MGTGKPADKDHSVEPVRPQPGHENATNASAFRVRSGIWGTAEFPGNADEVSSDKQRALSGAVPDSAS